MRILIAEDEEFSRNMRGGLLERLGHDVVAVSSGDEAWQILQDQNIQFVITDWNMPGMTGIELAQRIRSRPRTPYIYVVLLTVRSGKGDVIEGITEGADDFLSKPYDEDELRVRIRAGERVLQLEHDLKRANERMAKDLEAAARIQESLLPQVAPQNGSLDAAWVFRPCDELAGDTFNIFELDEDHIAFYLLDVVGHGVPAALLSVTLSRYLTPTGDRATDPFIHSEDRLMLPSEVAESLNRRFPMSDRSGAQFFTFLFATVNTKSGELCYVSAGHPSPVFIPKGGVPEVLSYESNACPIGVLEDEVFRNERLQLSPGDRIVVYSDGVLEAANPAGELFGEPRLVDCFREPYPSLSDEVNEVERSVLSWCEGSPATDDISVLAVSLRD